MEPKILNIETGTSVCSVAISEGEKIIALREDDGELSHAAKLSVFIDEILTQTNLSIANLDAIAVSEGPGSYTGMRIGASTAKGLCFGGNKPMIAVGSLQSLVQMAIDQLAPTPDTLLCPMIDARRMEVYTAIFNSCGKMLDEVTAKIIDTTTYAEELKTHKIIFMGNGAQKCQSIINNSNAQFADIKASAKGMAKIAAQKFAASNFVDIAYFEPFYLKDFVVTKSKKKIF